MISPLHVVVLTYIADLTEIDAALEEHVGWLDTNYADGTFLASGRRDPRVGGVILAGGIDRADLDRRLAADPFHRKGCAEYSVTTFLPSKTAPGMLGS